MFSFSLRDTVVFFIIIISAALLCVLLRLLNDSDVYVSMMAGLHTEQDSDL